MTANTQPRPLPLPFRIISAPLVWFERARGWRRRLLGLAYLLVLLVIGLVAWRHLSIAKLPDVGDPFDVDAFERECRIPDDRNAFVLYDRAIATYRTMPGPQNVDLWRAVWGGWAQAGPEVRQWLEANRDPLATWRRGAERPDASDPEALGRRIFGGHERLSKLTDLAGLALLEGSRHAQAKDMAGAWPWYRAALRCAVQIRRRSPMSWRFYAGQIDDLARGHVRAWAQARETDAASLRQALDEVRKLDAAVPPISESLKADYIANTAAIADPEAFMKDLQRGGSVVFDEMRWPIRAAWFLKNEPTRSRRVLRLIFANRLAQADRPIAQRPPRVTPSPNMPNVTLYDNRADPTTPAAARALDPKSTVEWLESTMLAWRISHLFDMIESQDATERSSRAVLIVTLAEQLYAREHGGSLPKSANELVGPYLDRLPDAYVPPPAATPRPKP